MFGACMSENVIAVLIKIVNTWHARPSQNILKVTYSISVLEQLGNISHIQTVSLHFLWLLLFQLSTLDTNSLIRMSTFLTKINLKQFSHHRK